MGTPGRINELMTKGALRLDQCRAVVLDEVDILLGELPAAPSHCACLLQSCAVLSFSRCDGTGFSRGIRHVT